MLVFPVLQIFVSLAYAVIMLQEVKVVLFENMHQTISTMGNFREDL